MMKIIAHLTWAYTLLVLRVPISLLFNMIVPLGFFMLYAVALPHPKTSISDIVIRLIALGAITNGLFGLSIHIVVMREREILRRYHLCPIGAVHIVISRLISSYLFFLAILIIEVVIAVVWCGLAAGPRLIPLMFAVTLGYLAIAGLGFIIASIVNTVGDCQVFNQVFFFVLLFLSGIAIPLTSLPGIAKLLAAYMPPALSIIAGSFAVRPDGSLFMVWREILSLVVISAVTLAVASFMFRWEKDTRVTWRDRLKTCVALVPMIAVGLWLNASGQFQNHVKATSIVLPSGLDSKPSQGK